ncbi:MAG TPA: ABC transporter permease [Arsenicitalea sp.]|jgi:NitT/TauT family transport system permease protein|nr:ABC transporter permease [Arsenicitalea sp.]
MQMFSMTGTSGSRGKSISAPLRLRQWLGRISWGVGSVVAGLLIWEFISRYLVTSSLFLAGPSQIFGAARQLAMAGELWNDIQVSAIEFVGGYLIASVAGIAIGVVLSNSKVAKQILQPWISGLYATPTIALAPLFILWLGVGVSSKIIMVVTLVIFPVIINTEAGLRTTNLQLVEMVRSFGASKRQVFLRVALPSALPFIFAGLKLGIGRGLMGVVVAELFGSRAGIGQLISQAADSFNMPQLFAGVIILAIAGVGLTAGFGWLEAQLLHWRE